MQTKQPTHTSQSLKVIIKAVVEPMLKAQDERIDKKFDLQEKYFEVRIKNAVHEAMADFIAENRQQFANLLAAIAEFAGRSEKQDQEMLIRNYTIQTNTKRIEKLETNVFGTIQS